MRFLSRIDVNKLQHFVDRHSSLANDCFDNSTTKKILIFIVSLFQLHILTGCSLDVTVTDLNQQIPSIEKFNRNGPDFIHGEVVTTKNGSIPISPENPVHS